MAYLMFAHIDDPHGIHLCGTDEHAGITVRADVRDYLGPHEKPAVARWLDFVFHQGIREANEPPRCSRCNGQGRIWRYRTDDRRYPVTCPHCAGSGVEPS